MIQIWICIKMCIWHSELCKYISGITFLWFFHITGQTYLNYIGQIVNLKMINSVMVISSLLSSCYFERVFQQPFDKILHDQYNTGNYVLQMKGKEWNSVLA